MTFVLKRLPSLSQEAFNDYWLNTHAPLVRSHAKTLGIRRYEQFHVALPDMAEATRTSRDAVPGYDGMALIEFESEAALTSGAGDPEFAAAARALLEDEQRFVDLPRSSIWFNHVHTIIASGDT
jgi:hypothetical protein